MPPSLRTSAHLTDTPLPADPAGPAGPAGPCGPAGPAGPAGPRGICPDLKSARSKDPFLTFEETTALSLSWSVPTLFLGTATATAATPVPPRATSSASAATTIDGDGLMRRNRVMKTQSSLDPGV